MDSAMVNDDQFQLLTCIDICTVLTEFIDDHDFKSPAEIEPEPSIELTKPKSAVATFGAGCYWGVEHMFRKRFPKIKTVVGFMSPEKSITSDPTYQELQSGDLGHIEVVQITFNPLYTPYTSLVHHFFSLHDPTQFSQQGSDVGQQYSSVIFTHDQE